MIFRDIENHNDESIYGVEVSKSGASCGIRWNYPFKCSEVRIFEVPFDTEFSESDAAAGKYRMHSAAHPVSQISADTVCNFAVYAVDSEGALIRQKKTLYFCPVRVCFSIREDRRVTVEKKGWFRKTEKVTVSNYLNIHSDISVAGRKILYRLKNGVSIDSKTFCLPINLEAGQTYRLNLPHPVELFSEDENISINME